MDTSKFQILVCLYLGIIALVNGQGGNYGQSCTNNENCASSDIRDVMICNGTSETTKVCACPQGMFRHDELDRCVSPHGGPCTLQSGDGSRILTCTEFAQCWPNQSSGTNAATLNGICHCDMDATFDDKFTLKCKLTHGSTRCKKVTDCDVMSLLTCNEEKCVCVGGDDQEYDAQTKKCRVKVNGPCANTPPYPKPDCGSNMECDEVSKLCKCSTGFEEAPDRTCGKVYNATCQDTSECHPQFTCKGDGTNKTCGCREGHEYHEGSRTCRILVGQHCGTNETQSFECTLHAECKNEKCTCTEGYDTNPDNNKCMALFGSVCSDTEGIFCKSDDFLDCVDATCQCKPNYESDKGQKKCIGKIGQACRNNDNSGCIANSICSEGSCKCQERQTANNANSQCLGLLGANCDPITTPCSEGHHVSCNGTECVCEDPVLQLPEEQKFQCVAKADTPCASGIDCVTNSTCSAENRCTCNPGHVKDEEGRCVETGTSVVYKPSFILVLGLVTMVMGKL